MKKKLVNKKKLWGSKLGKGLNKTVEEFTESISFDYRLYNEDITGSIAHVEMLEKCQLITSHEKRRLIRALKNIKNEISKKIEKGIFKVDKSYEDIHTYIEKKVIEKIGADIGSKLHTARSRNDQVSTDTRLYIKKDIYEVLKLLKALTDRIIDAADKNKYCIMPAYTHMQIAKPVYFRDYIRAYYEMFTRDMERLCDCLKRLNFCPLGSGAVGGVHYSRIDRRMVAKRLGFKEPMRNTVDAVSDRDYVMEYLFDLSTIMTHISRMSEDFVTWLSPQFQFIKIDSSFTTGSSILPQKKNPDVCELSRAKTGRVYGNLIAFLTVMKGLPLSYNRDMQEDKELLFDSSDSVKTTLNVYSKLLGTVRADKKRMLEAITSVEFAGAPILVDYFAQKGLGLRRAHEFVSRLIYYCTRKEIGLKDLTRNDYMEDFLKKEYRINRKTVQFLKDNILKVI